MKEWGALRPSYTRALPLHRVAGFVRDDTVQQRSHECEPMSYSYNSTFSEGRLNSPC